MEIEVDVRRVPPVITLIAPDDFKSFKVVIRLDEHTFVAPTLLAELAGDRADDPAWRSNLEGMLAYAADHGWLDEAGNVRAHVETETAPPS